eukprot:m.258233 g.258233  ORF g.258233 m.258233 type:complete len:395 (+) comp36303_c0_seq1:184-1368(+)
MTEINDAPPARGLEYTDEDGTVMEWDASQRAYFPKIDTNFMAQYQMSYGTKNAWTTCVSPEGYTYYYNTATKESTWTLPAEFQQVVAPADSSAPGFSYQELVDQDRIQKGIKDPDDEDEEPVKKKGKMEKREDEAGFFTMDDKTNTFVYLQGLPTEDLEVEEVVKFLAKGGIIADDDKGNSKVKLYRDEEDNLKGDGRVCFLKPESVGLAIMLLDQTEIRAGHVVTITRATFTPKATFDPTKKPDKKKKPKAKNKLDAKQAQKKRQLGWHENEEGKVKKKAAGVVVIKHMFDPKEFDEDPMYLNEIRDDLQSECGKFGTIKKIMIFDRHPEGVVSIKFEDVASVDVCIKAMNGRWFAKKQLEALMWDGVTSYKIEESDLERENRLKKWDADLSK